MELSNKEIAKLLRNPHGELAGKVGSEMCRKNRPMIDATIHALNITRGSRLLEIGFGNGGHIEDLFTIEETVHYCGIDISEPMVAEAQKNCSKRLKEGDVELLCTDGKNIPFKDSIFNIVFSVNTIYFWDDPAGYLKEINRVTKPGGQLVLTFGSKRFMQKLPFTKDYFRLYNTDDIKALLTDTGFTFQSVKEQSDRVESATGEKVEREFLVLIAES